MAVQPVLGMLHHRHYVKTQARGIISYVHIWMGRVLMVLGVLNGGFGLQLASESQGYIIAYAVVSVVVFLTYFGFKAWKFFYTPKGSIDGAESKRENSRGSRRPYP